MPHLHSRPLPFDQRLVVEAHRLVNLVGRRAQLGGARHDLACLELEVQSFFVLRIPEQIRQLQRLERERRTAPVGLPQQELDLVDDGDLEADLFELRVDELNAQLVVTKSPRP
jgi:hypothetical protein